MRKRIEWLDIAKGICILLVVLGHELTWDEGLRYSIYAFHIPMFFILSGMTAYITGETEKGFNLFLKRNVNGLLKPYFIGSGFYILFDLIRGGVQHSLSIRIIVFDVYQTLVCYGINVLWFVITLFLAKIIFYWVLKIKKSELIKFSMLCVLGIGAVGLIALLTVALQNTQLKNPVMWMAIGVLRPVLALPFVYVGFTLYPTFCKEVVQKDNSICRASIGSCFILFVIIPAVFKMKITMVNMVSEPIWMVLVSGIVGSMGMISISFLIEQSHFLKKALIFFGKNSLTIMLTHEYLQIRSSIQNICENTINNHAGALVITFIGVVVVETVICLLWSWYKDQVYENIVKR